MTLQTSRKQVPASAKRLSRLAPKWSYANNILNFGCGKFPDLTEEYLTNYHKQIMTVTHYDPNSKAKGVVNNTPILTAQNAVFASCYARTYLTCAKISMQRSQTWPRLILIARSFKSMRATDLVKAAT
ncbi:MAG: hypothetical protein AAGJ90_18185 [Pseudomonadota bacterium]|uniref:hypothetical protein n=1 Tax=Vibrio campbellii TaxID=680 RepID=UPI001D176664|nr:hypothetical protein [Vibrio campbellii]MCC4224948.1 hypothetical protein [Vibrio campbellii]